MLGALQQFLYYRYQKLILIWPQSSNCLRYTLWTWMPTTDNS